MKNDEIKNLDKLLENGSINEDQYKMLIENLNGDYSEVNKEDIELNENNEFEVEIDVEEKFEDEFKIESENFGTENF